MSKKTKNTDEAKTNKDESEVKNTLSEYVENNSKLISVLGVFTVLTVFSQNFTIKPIGLILSFIFFSISIIVWLELWTKFPKRPSSWRLIAFENILNLSIFGIILYWLLAYRIIWKYVLVFIVWFILISLIGYPITRFKLFEKIIGLKLAKFTIVRILFGIGIILIVFYVSAYIALLVNDPVNNALDQLRNDLDKILINSN